MIELHDRFEDRKELLKLDNFQNWQKKINKLLEFFDAADHLSETPVIIDEQEWNDDDLSIKNFLIDRIGDENIKKSVANCETTFEIWSKLKKFFDNKLSFDLFSKFDNFEIQNNNLTESIKQFEQSYEETNSFINQSNYLSYKLLNSLPSCYNDFRSKILCGNNLDYEQIKIKLFNEKNLIDKMTIQNRESEDENNNLFKQQNTINRSTINSQQNENTISNDNGKRNLTTTDYENSVGKKIKKVYNDNMDLDNNTLNTNQFHSSTSTNKLSKSTNIQFHPLPSTSHVQEDQILLTSAEDSALIGPKSMNGSYFFSDYSSTFNLFDKKEFGKINLNYLEKLYFIGILDDKILKSINKFVNLIDLQIQSINCDQNKIENIRFNHDHLNNFVFSSCNESKIELKTKFLKILSTNLKLNNLNFDRNQVEFLNLDDDLVVETEIEEIQKFKNIKTLQLNEKITYELFDLIKILKDKLDHLDKIILYCLEIESKELLKDLIEYSDKESSPNIYYQSIKLNNQVVIDLNKNQLYNQLNNYKYLDENVDLEDNIIDFNELIEILRELNVPEDFFNRYKSVNCIKFTNLVDIDNSDIERCTDFLVNMQNLNKMEIRITRKVEPLFEKLIVKLKDRLVKLSIDTTNESKLDINLIASLPKLSVLKINKVLKNVELTQLTSKLKNLEIFHFKRQINNEDKTFKIEENDDIDGDCVFCLYIDNDDEEIFTHCDLRKMIKHVIDNYKNENYKRKI